MGYEINVSKLSNRNDHSKNTYVHYFATADRSIGHDNIKLRAIYDQFKTLFPSPEYKITVSKIETIGEEIIMG